MAKINAIIKVDDAATKQLQAIKAEVKSLGQAANDIKSFQALELLAGVGEKIKGVFSQALGDYTRNEAEVAKLGAVLATTGNQVGMTAQELEAYADTLEKTKLVQAETAMGAASVAIAMGTIKGDNLKGVLAVSADIARVLGKDMQSVTQAIAKAFDAGGSIDSLKKIGVIVDEQTQAYVENLRAQGKETEAQAVLVQELESRYKGVADAMGDTLGGSLERVNIYWGDFMENVVGSLSPIAQVGAELTGNLLKGLSGLPEPLLAAGGALGTMAVAVPAVVTAFNLLGPAVNTVKAAMAGLAGPVGIAITAVTTIAAITAGIIAANQEAKKAIEETTPLDPIDAKIKELQAVLSATQAESTGLIAKLEKMKADAKSEEWAARYQNGIDTQLARVQKIKDEIAALEKQKKDAEKPAAKPAAKPVTTPAPAKDTMTPLQQIIDRERAEQLELQRIRTEWEGRLRGNPGDQELIKLGVQLGFIKKEWEDTAEASEEVKEATGEITAEIRQGAVAVEAFNFSSVIASAQEAMGVVQQFGGQLLNLFALQAQNEEAAANYSISQIKRRMDADMEAHDARIDQYSEQMATAKQFGQSTVELERAQIEAKKQKAEAEKANEQELARLKNEAGRKAFEANKGNQIANAIMSGASAALQTFAQFGFPWGVIPAGLMAGITAAQVGQISAQQYYPSFATGGIVYPNGNPMGRTVNVAEREVEYILRQSQLDQIKGSGGTAVVQNYYIQVDGVVGSPEETATKIHRTIRQLQTEGRL